MWKVLGLLAVGIAGGVGVALYMQHDAGSDPLPSPADATQFSDLKESVVALDRRVRQLTMEVEALRAARAQQGEAGSAGEPGERFAGRPEITEEMRQRFAERGGNPPDMAAMRERQQQRDLDRLVQAGFTPERAQWIARRTEELRVAQMEAQFEAQRSGQRVQVVDPDQALRKEMGDAEYERYLTATGRPTEVRVMDVLASSSAERSGIKPGDEILAYNGTRVFDTRELNALTMAGTPGQTTIVEVRRNGQTLQVSVPSGPLGVTAPGGGGGRGGGGPPGGFRPNRGGE